jgi:hypothetical protein
MVNSLTREGKVYTLTSAGVLIEKGLQRRLTCSWHNWQDHADKYPGKFGQTDAEAQRFFRAAQGQVDNNPGTTIGFVRERPNERLGDSDIALMQLDQGIQFENRFMDMNSVAKTLVPPATEGLWAAVPNRTPSAHSCALTSLILRGASQSRPAASGQCRPSRTQAGGIRDERSGDGAKVAHPR